MADVIKSYLVSISAHVDKQSFDKFTQAMTGAEKTVSSSVGGILGKFLAFQVAGTTAFATVGFGLIGYIDKLAMLDRKTQILAAQNMMSVQQYRSVSMALDAMGLSLEDVFFGTREIQDQFQGLIQDQKQLAAMLGPGYEESMKQIRAVVYQLQRLEIKGEYFGMKFAEDLLAKLGFGQGGIEMQLERLNDWVMQNMPRWSDELTNEFIPALGEMWDVLKRTGHLFLDLSVDFDNFVGTLSGDQNINTKTASFESFALSIEHVVYWLGEAIKLMLGLEQVGVHSVGSIWDLGKAFLSMPHRGGSADESWKALNDAADEAVKATHGFETMGQALLSGTPYGDQFSSQTRSTQLASAVSGYSPDFLKLVHGVAMQESGDRQFDSAGNVIMGPSIAGTTERAIGRMQILPSTAKILGIDPYDAGQNLAGGEKYLLELLKKHQGNIHDTLKEYGGFRTQSPDNYVRNVERLGGITIGTISVNSSPNFSPEQHTEAIKKGVGEAMKTNWREMMLEHNGAYH
jgi:hypothetical protein